MKLDGKRILITGGSSGIGLALAEALLSKGARVVITGRRRDVLTAAIGQLGADGAVVKGIAADVTTAEGRDATLAFAMGALGGLDILVNNAGGVRAGRQERTSEEEIMSMIAIDLAARRSTRPTLP
jgi:uncharacterized oxidoreductase